MAAISVADRLGVSAVADQTPLEARSLLSEAQVQEITRAVYRQILGNDHLFTADIAELQSLESLLRRGSLTVREFVRAVAKSEAYKRRFLYPNSQTRAIELNFKHLLGRAPTDRKDISFHLDLFLSKGHDGEIDSYLDSPEYLSAFGENIVPYPRGFAYHPSHTTRDFTNLFTLYRGYASNDRAQGKRPRLMKAVGENFAPAIQRVWSVAPSPRHLGPPPVGTSDGMFCVELTNLKNPVSDLATSRRVRRANRRVFVSGDQLSDTLQRELKSGAKVVSVRRA